MSELVTLGAQQLRAMMLADGPVGVAVSNTFSLQTGPVIFITDEARYGHVNLSFRNNTAKALALTPESLVKAYLPALEPTEVAHITFDGGWVGRVVEGVLELRPASSLAVAVGQELTIPLHRVLTAKEAGSANCRFEYSRFGDLPEGGKRVMVFRQRPPQYAKTPPLVFAFGARNDYQGNGNTIYVTPFPITEQARGISNHFVLQLVNTDDKAIEKPAGSSPRFVVSFTTVASGDSQPALCRDEQLKVAACAMQQGPELAPWQIAKDTSGEVAIWTLRPAQTATTVFDGRALVGFAFSDIVSQSASETGSPMFVQYVGIPGYDDGHTALVLQKAAPMPFVRSCGAYDGDRLLPFDSVVGFRQTITIRWDVFAAEACRLTGVAGKLPPTATHAVQPDKESMMWLLVPEVSSRPGAPWTLQLRVSPPRVEVSASTSAVAPGTSVTLSWKCVDGAEAFLNGPGITSEAVALTGSRAVIVAATSTYTIRCNGTIAVSGSVEVRVPPVEATIVAHRDMAANTMTVSWTSRYANSCTVKWEAYPLSTRLQGSWSTRIVARTEPAFRFFLVAKGKDTLKLSAEA